MLDDSTGAAEALAAAPSRRRQLILLAVALVLLYLLAPALAEVYSSARDLSDIRFGWFALMILLMIASHACLWALLLIAMPPLPWRGAAESELAANAFSRIVPGGAAAGGGLQFAMLRRSGIAGETIATSLTAVGIIQTGVILAMPFATVPVLVSGPAIPGELARAAWLSVVVFVVLAVVATLLSISTQAIRAIAAVVSVLSRLFRRPIDHSALASRLGNARSDIRAQFGRHWPKALAAGVGNRVFEYLVLLVALHAAGAEPGWAVYLLAFVAASLLAMIPLTPGGLGFVEAGLAGTLGVAGVPLDTAAIATLIYRLVTFWAPLPLGAIAWLSFRRRTSTLPVESSPPAT